MSLTVILVVVGTAFWMLLFGPTAGRLLGISIGRALEDGPSPGGTQTNVRTLQPQPLPPAARTVTVTVTD